MAKNSNNDGGGILQNAFRSQSDNVGYINKLTELNKRPKIVVWSFLVIAAIMLLSFAIPEKYYTKDVNILLLNIELLILFARDLYLYFKRSCRVVKWIIRLMVSIYVINIIDLLFDIPHNGYVTLCLALVVIVLGIVYLKKQK